MNATDSADLFRTLSHRLRRPLGDIVQYADLIIVGTEGEVSQAALEDIHHMRGLAAQALETVDSILDLVRVQSRTYRMTSVRLPALLRHSEEDTRELAAALNRYVVNLTPDHLPEVWADGALIQTTLTSLLRVMIRLSQQDNVNMLATAEGDFVVVHFWEGKELQLDGPRLSLNDFLRGFPDADPMAMALLVAACVAARHDGALQLSTPQSSQKTVNLCLSLPILRSEFTSEEGHAPRCIEAGIENH